MEVAKKLYHNKDWLRKKYWDEELSTLKIAKLCNVTHEPIRIWMIKFNIPRRSKKENSKIQKELWQNPDSKYNSLGYRRKIGEAARGNKNMLGKHFSKEAKRKISESLKGEKNGFYGKHHTRKTREIISNVHKGKIPKCINFYPNGIRPFGNILRGYYNINGKEIFFRSKWEANYSLYLDFLIKQKQIKKWEYEPDVFMFEKIKLGTRSYRPDFKIYNNDDSIEYHEVKGWMTPRSKTKIKRMAKYYPDIKLIIIDKNIYGEIKKKLGRILKFY